MSEIKLYNADCMDILKSMEDNSIDLILTDPPYWHPHLGGNGKSDIAQRANRLKEDIAFMSDNFDYVPVFEEFMRVCKIPNMLIFCSNAQISQFMRFFEDRDLTVTLLEWVKTNPIPTAKGNYLSDVEYIVFVRGKGCTFNDDVPFDYKRKVWTSGLVSNKDRLHPAQKPIELLEKFLTVHSKEGETVLDCFMGSGSTGVACKHMNRNFIGIEREPKFFEICEQRINGAGTQRRLF